MRTRFAPTPNGCFHLGNWVSFTVTAALAEAKGLQTLLRWDDLDRLRVDPQSEEDFSRVLKEMEIPFPSRSIRQSERIELYRQAIERLDDSTYWCSCTRSEILRSGSLRYPGTCRDKKLSRMEGLSLRLKAASDPVVLRDFRLGTLSLDPHSVLGDPVLLRKDGVVGYNLASVIDDIGTNISHIVRGADLLMVSANQLRIANALNSVGYNDILYLHHPLVLEAGEKLSKSRGSPSRGFGAARVLKEISDAFEKSELDSFERIVSYFQSDDFRLK